MAPLFPAPDVVCPPPTHSSLPQAPSQPSDFIIVKLFALHLTRQLIESLDDYPNRRPDIAWLNAFLQHYPEGSSLAKVSGARKADYTAHYAAIVQRMKKQPRYPIRFMQMNPDPHVRLCMLGRDKKTAVAMNDDERRQLIDFCDAATEWGSVVLIPADEARRMVELADQRQIVE